MEFARVANEQLARAVTLVARVDRNPRDAEARCEIGRIYLEYGFLKRASLGGMAFSTSIRTIEPLMGSPPSMLKAVSSERHGASHRCFSPRPAASAVPLSLEFNTSGGEPYHALLADYDKARSTESATFAKFAIEHRRQAGP